MRFMPRLVLACVAATTVISLAACVSSPSQDARSAPAYASERPVSRDGPKSGLGKDGVQSAEGNVIIKMGDLHCAEPSHPLHGTYPDCNAIPVVVLLKPLGGCIALMPYVNLYIHSDKKRVRVVWQILGPSDYEFAANDGIAISKVTGTTDPTLPSRNYDRKQNQGNKWKWELSDEALYPETFYHLPNVVQKKTGKPCEPIDPGMVNVVN